MIKGYFLHTATNDATIIINDAMSGAIIAPIDNGMGGVAYDVKRGRIYKASIIARDGKGMGWFFHGFNFDAGYNYFSI